jgi:regulator of replication initiation timing
MDINPQDIIDQLLEEVKRLTLENAALRAVLGQQHTEDTPEADAAG